VPNVFDDSMKKIALVVPLVVAIAVAGCNEQDAGDLKRDAGQLAASGVEAAKNATVAVKVNTALGLHKKVDMKYLHVEAKEGVVTLSGHVKTLEEKRLIAEIAFQTKGVEKVIDLIRVEP
jgi:osmotically-inducible protein OsmY